MALDSQQIDKMDGRINKRGSELFFAEATLEHGAANGIDDLFALYAAGRGGVMGEVTAAQIASAFAFFEPNVVAQVWAKALTLAKPSAPRSMPRACPEQRASRGRPSRRPTSLGSAERSSTASRHSAWRCSRGGARCPCRATRRVPPS
jgi:hypothetical protein